MASIIVDGKSYKVTETIRRNAGFNHTAKFVKTQNGERVAVKRGGVWTWWTPNDRLSWAREIGGLPE